jgi:polyphosphate kinase
MNSGRVLRFDIPSRAVLDEIALGPLPGGLNAGPAGTEFCRDVYFETDAHDLERRGVTARLRFESRGTCSFAVDVRERQTEDGQIVRSRAEAVVPETTPAEVLAGDSEPARLLRSIVDTTHLPVHLEVETMRRVRLANLAARPELDIELLADAVTVRHQGLTAEFQQLEIRLPAEEVDELEGPLGALEREMGLRVTLATKLARAHELLERMQLEALEGEIRSARETAVIALQDGQIALLRKPEGLRIPVGNGAGEEACRQVLRATFGNSEAQVRPLGTSAGLGNRPAIEVWLADRVRVDERREDGLIWLPLDHALALVGSPTVRESTTLTALHMAARVNMPAGVALWSADAQTGSEHPFRLVQRLEGTDDGAFARIPLPSAAGTDRPPPEALLNMELSELAFNERVVALAEDGDTPLLDRVRFLSIFGSNLDQFFATRVAGFHQQLAKGSRKVTLDGLTPAQQLDAIAIRARGLIARAYHHFWEVLLPELEENGIGLALWQDLNEQNRSYLRDNYAAQLGAVLTPLAADPSHPFPHIRNLRPALAVIVRVPETDAEHFAAIELPSDLPRFVPLPGGRRFVPMEEVIRALLPTLYRGLEVVEAHVFRVTRSANFSIDDEDVTDLLQAVQEKVYRRPLGPVVRLEVQDSMPPAMRQLLLRELQFDSSERISTLREEDVYAVDGLVDLYGLIEIAELPLDELHYPPVPVSSPLDGRVPVWEIFRERSVLVEFPRDSFEQTVERVLAEAAEDPEVVSIKITLYRTSRMSKVVQYLRHARRMGKDVLAVVELKASFDEQRNIEWARALESAGIHVIYGPAHLKVHAKVMLIVRREEGGLKRYLYIGTGNLNAATAAGYTDLGLFMTDPRIGAELHDLFNALAGYSVRNEYEHLLVAPFNMRERFLELIAREIEHAEAGRGGKIRVKINGLTDPEIIVNLYRASRAGVKVEMVIRGICCLRPGVPGLSENIRVLSILGRYLEHSRIFRFDNAGDPEYFIGSADWRPRNLSRRVEAVTPVYEENHRAELDRILEESLANPDAWELQSDGRYLQATAAGVRTSDQTYLG